MTQKMESMYAVINTNWEADGWNNWFYEQTMAIRNEQIFGVSIFLTRKEAEKFKKGGNHRKDKIIKVIVTPVPPAAKNHRK